MIRLQRLRHVITKEFVQIRRDPLMLRMIIAAPIIQLILFGYAATNDVRNVPVAIADCDNSPESRRLAEEIAHSHYFVPVAAGRDPRQIEQLLLTGRAQIGVHIPYDFSRQIHRGETAQVGVYVDGTDSNTAGVATSYLAGILAKRAERISLLRMRRAGLIHRSLPRIDPEPRVWYNQNLKSTNYMVPGVFGLILLVLTLILASLAIVRERETGTLEQLIVTPLRRSELVVGKLLPFALIGMVDASIIFVLAIGWFRVPFRGSLLILFSMAVVFLMGNLGIGLLNSAVSRTQQEAQIVSFLLAMPSVLLSGFMFPIENMPQAIQYLTYIIPFRYFLEIVRGVFLKGLGVGVLWPQMVILTAMTVATLAAGVAAFRKRL